MKNALIAAGVSVVVVVLAFMFYAPVKEVALGAQAGPDHTERQYFYDDAIIGGNNFATSSAGSVTYTAAQIFNNKLITHTATAALTATLPASSTVTGIPRTGDSKVLYLTPITTGITFAAGTGTDFNTSSSTKFCVVNSLCRFDFVRKSTGDIEVLFQSATGL